MKHTKGPWRVSDNQVQSVQGATIVMAWGKTATEADKKLIASAPELLQALIDARVTIKAFLPEAWRTLEVIESAIKKPTL